MLKLLTKLKLKEIILMVINAFFIVVQVWLDLRLPEYMSNITTLVQTPGSSMNDILAQGYGMLSCIGASLVTSIIIVLLSSFIGAGFAQTLREEMFDKVYSFGMEEVKRFSISSLITRTTNDITHVQRLVAMGLQIAIRAPIMAVWAISKIVNKSYMLSGLTGIAVVISGLVMFIAMLIVVPKFKLMQKLTDRLNSVSREGLLGIRVVRAYNAERYQENKFEEVNEDITRIGKFTGKAMSLLWPIVDLIHYGLTIGIYVVGAILINNAVLDMKLELFSNIIVFSNYSSQVLAAFMMLSMIVIMYPRVSVSSNRILEVLNTKPTMKQGTVDQHSDVKGLLEVKNISFKYPDANKYILKNISFTANQGETIAILGSTGCGKSTLLNLIHRFYDVESGEILIDGINVKDYTRETLNSKFGYVPQKAILLSGNVSENVAYGTSGGDKPQHDDIVKAVQIAQAERFVLEMDDGYQSEVARGGNNLSGGQKQRLQIARAIARQPEFYIFDDSFSALDYKTDATLRSELKKHSRNITNLVVSQRISTIRYADKILVLDDGHVVGEGRHNDLLDTCPLYRAMAEAQLRKEELYNET